jgi:hypothetical protein
VIWTVDHSPGRSFGDRDFEISRTHCNRNSEIAKRDIAIQSQPLSQDRTRTVDPTHDSRPRQLSDTWHNQVVTSVRMIQHFRHMWVTNQSDMWQYLTRVKPRVTSAEASTIGTIHLRDRCRRSRQSTYWPSGNRSS